MALTKTQVSELYVAIFGRASEGEGNKFWQTVDASAAEIADEMLTTAPAQEYFGETLNSPLEFIKHIYLNTLGRTYEDDAEGIDYWSGRLEAGESHGAIVVELISVLQNSENTGDAQDSFKNRVEVSNYTADNLFAVPADVDTALSFSAEGLNVNEDPATVEAANRKVDAIAQGEGEEPGEPEEPGVEGETIRLTQRADDLQGADGVDTTFVARVTQNETGSGALANTFETGDVLDGGANSNNTLRADLIATGTIQDGLLGSQGVAISAETTNVQNVFLRAQASQVDYGADNTTFQATIDAEKMVGVEQWWTDNSRADVRIEDVRSRPTDTILGMRNTDPEVGFEVYFNPLFMDGGQSSQSQLVIQIAELDGGVVNTAAELANISVNALSFELDGDAITISSDAMAEANTWEELEAAIVAALAEEGLGDLQVTRGDEGQFLLFDAEGREFSNQGGFTASATTDEQIDIRNRITQDLQTEDEQTETTLVLDGAGNGSRGGDVNIAAMSGDRGVEVFNVQVDNDSHIRTLRSENNPRDTGSYAEEQQLEEVYLTHVEGGAQGAFQLGSRTVEQSGVSTTTDDRLDTDGLLDVRVFDATGFTSNIKLGAALTESVFDKYLDGADEAVQFSYLLGDGGSNLSLSVEDDVAADPDFALEIIGGAGDDRINLSDLGTKNSTVIDGGAGNNTVEVNTSTGADPRGLDAWAGFENIQTLVVAGNGSTHNLVTGNMAGVENVIVATMGGTTTVQQLRMDQGLTVSGKNQTLSNGSNSDQNFNAINIEGTSAVPGVAAFDLLLDNTARVGGVTGELSIGTLNVGATATGVPSAISTLNIESAGRRDTTNTIDTVNAGQVATFDLNGSQDLTIGNLAAAANHAANANARSSLVVDGSDLGGDLYLGIDSAVISAIDGGTTSTVTLTGTAGDSDVLALNGAGLDVRTSTSINGFETLAFGEGAAASGRFNAVGVNGVELYDIVALDLTAQQAVEAQLPGAEADVTAAETAAAPFIGDVEAAESVLQAAQQAVVDATAAQSDFAALSQAYNDALNAYVAADADSEAALVAAYNALVAAMDPVNAPPALVGYVGDGTADAADAALIDGDDAATQTAITAEDGALTTAIGTATTAVPPLEDALVLAENAAAPALADLADAQAALDALIASAQSLTVVNLRGEVDVRIDGDDADGNILLNEEAEAATTNVLNVELVGDYSSELTANSFNTVNVQLSLAQGQQTNDWEFGLNVDQYARTLNVTGGSATQTAVSSVELVDLSTSLTRIDFSGFVGDVEAGFGLDADIPVTNSVVVLNGYNFEWDNAAVSGETVVTTFRIESEAVSDSTTWTFDGFKGFVATNSLSDLDILDLRALGIEGLSNIVIDDTSGDTVITSNDGLQFEIVLTGVAAADISNENFMFAA